MGEDGFPPGGIGEDRRFKAPARFHFISLHPLTAFISIKFQDNIRSLVIGKFLVGRTGFEPVIFAA